MSTVEKYTSPGMQINTLDEAMRYAEAMAGAGMIPDRFKRQPANILVAQEIAQTMGESTWLIMSELYFVGAVPTFSAKYMRSRVRSAGHKLRETFDKETGTARAVIIRADDPEFEHVAEWDDAKAQKHGLLDKGHWLKNPELMKKNRAVSEVIREACYEVMGGIAYTTDEAQDFVKMDARRMDQQPPRETPTASPQADTRASEPQTPREYWNGGKAEKRTRQQWVAAFTQQLLSAENTHDADKLQQLLEYVQKHSDGELVRMTQTTMNRMKANAPAPEEKSSEEVFEGEIVEPEEV